MQTPTPRIYLGALVGLAAIALSAGLVGYLAGSSRPSMAVHTAIAQSGDDVISAEADGWVYGIPIDVRWQDAAGSWHEHGRPACIPPRTQTMVTFGSIEARVNGVGWRPVVWVSCQR